MSTKGKKPAPATKPAAPTTAKLQRHPLSEKFSLPTSDEERIALGTDMAANGQHQEIITYEGMVLDGWERYMGCLQQGLTPKFKTYTGNNPAAVAFGANAIRRKLNSVQKALFGAKYFMHCQSEGSTGITQKLVAKSACCSLQRLNEIVQLLRAVDTNSDAARCVSTLNTNPDVTAAMLQTMLADAGIVDVNARSKPGTGAPAVKGLDDDGDDDDALDAVSDSNVDDLLNGSDIDDLLDDEDGVTHKREAPTPRGDKGTRIGGDKKSRETPASAAAKHFRALTEPERVDFVKFAWSMLRPAVEACVQQGRVEWPLLDAHADAGKAALADVAGALSKASNSSRIEAGKKPDRNDRKPDRKPDRDDAPKKPKRATAAAPVDAVAKPAAKRGRKPATA